MAEAAVTFALKQIRDLVLAEGRLLSGVDDEVKALETQLKEIKCLLQDADGRRHENKTIFNWISEIRDLSYRAEAAIEIHAARVSSMRSRGFRKLVRRCSCILEEGCSLHQEGSEISKIKSELARISKEMQENGITRSIINLDGRESSASNDNQNWLRKTFPHFEIDDCFVGMEDELKQLVSLLVNDREHRVISVWGMGGSGKTTIARKVYNDVTQTKYGCFHLSAWVCITQQCQIRSVLEDVVKQLDLQKRKDISRLSDMELMERLCEIQREKRCLIVLDDLWKVSHWDGLKHAFLVQNLQSKVLITTREEEVAEIGFPVELGLLNMEDALELLKKKAFPHSNIPEFACEEKFDKVGIEMVRKCGYLPLAISLLGGVLRKKSSMTEWELVNKNMNMFIYRDENEIDGVLNLSYESLPYYLKPCFLYMGILKEDESIYAEELYTMWIAQGMISYENIRDNGEKLLDIAEAYLSDLVSRSIVQVEIYDDVTPTRKYKSCKLHDVIRELCLKMGKKEEFGVQILEYQRGKFSTLLRETSSHIKIQHLAIHFKREVEPEHDELTITCGEETSKHLRSLRILNRVNSNVVEFPPKGIVNFQKFKLLRDLVIVRFKFAGRKLPTGITNLVHLRSLRLLECEVDKLPWSIRNLVYLGYLDLGSSRNVRIPNVIKKMFRLKHMILPYYDVEIIGNYRLTLDEGVDELESLLWLDSRVHELKCIGRMKNLRHFSAIIHDHESLSAITNFIATYPNKLAFCEVIIEKDCHLRTNEGLKKAFTCPNLYYLRIRVKIGKVLAECSSDLMSSKLTMLILSNSEMEDDPMGILGKLQCLRELILYWSSFVGEEMTCPSISFPRLKRLVMEYLPKLREWRVEAGAMPLLSELQISNCSQLQKLPDGLTHISTLQKLIISRMPELGKKVLPSGHDLHKVRHVPSILIQDH